MGIIYDQGQKPWDDGTATSATKTMFGDMDIIANVNAGNSYADQLAFYEANPSQQGGGGIGGSVHAKLVAGAAAEKAAAGSGGGGGGGNNYSPVPITSKPYVPGDIFGDNPGSESGGNNEFSYEDFLADRREKRQAAKDLAEMYAQNSDGDLISTVNVDQNVGSFKNFDNTIVGDNNSNIGNDYSFNEGQLKLVNAPFGVA